MKILRTICFFIVVFAVPLSAQVNATGSIAGQVRDGSGATVPNAQIVVTEQPTGISWAASTATDGYYTVPLLSPSVYSVRVTAPGFETGVRRDLMLQIGQTVRQDFTLQVGDVRTNVMVTGDPPLLNTESSEIGNVISIHETEQLPLNGRNFSQLALLVPGANPGPVGGIRTQGNGNETQRAGAEIVANGARGSFNSFMIDGIDDRDQSVGTIKVFPNLEAIQGFQVQTGNYDAQFASGGAVVNVITRSGSNELHGSAFEFLRNSALDARQYFDARKPQFQLNQFGVAIGGPIRKNRTFFFFDYQGLRIHTAATSILTEPTAAMRAGDFSAFPSIIYDPASFNPSTNTRTAFAGNVIAPGRIDPIAKNLLAIFPLPNLPGVRNNLRINPLRVQVEDQFDVRVDHRFSDRDSGFARYTYGRADISYPATPVLIDGIINPLAFAQGTSTSGSLEPNHAPSYQATLQEVHHFTPNLLNQFALGYTRLVLLVTPLDEGLNTASLLGLQGANTGPNSDAMSSLTISGQSGYSSANLPEDVPQNTYQISDTLFYTRGAHLLRFGFSAIQNRFGFFQLGSPSGALSYTGIYTNNPANPTGTGTGFADFLLGLPVSVSKSSFPQGTPFARYSEYGAFIQDQWHATNRLTVNLGLRYDLFTPVSERYNRLSDVLFPSGTLVVAGQDGASSSIIHLQKHDFSPRIGLAYQLGDKSAIRAAYGLFYFNEQGIGGSTRLFINFPFAAQFTVACSSTLPCLSTSTGIPLTPSANNLPNAVYQPITNLTPNIQQWNLTIERQLAPSLVAQAAYVGNHGNRLNINIDENVPFPGPGPVAPRRPLPAYAAVSSWEPRGISNYNALQLSAEKRFGESLSFLAAYTWGKSVDEGGGGNSSAGDPRINIQDPRNIRANYGLSSFDYRQRFTLSTVYELPFGTGRRFMKNPNSFENALAAGWQIASIVAAQSGAPFSVSLSTPTANTGTFTRPNRICNGNLPADQQRITRWFDTSCFVNPPPFAFGNTGRNILIGPGLFTWDLAADKDFHLSDRFGLQFRSEFFNILNRANFGLPNASIGSAPAGTITSVVTNARQIQFALRLHW
jgi:outer membrane receptor protein involved in Fe transport